MAGLDSTGFVPKTTEDILADIETAQRASIDPTLDTSAETVLGNLNAIVTTKLRELWELGAAVYKARDPRGAVFDSLDAVCAFTGTVRRAASKGLATLTVTLTAGTTLPQGSVAHVTGQASNRWRTKASVTNSTGSSAAFQVLAEAEVAGPYIANAGTITVIATPVSGWTAVTNAFDAAAGAEVEKDPALRVRRELELSRPGTATVPAIQADLADVQVDGESVVAAVFVEENTSAYYDSQHRPPHCIEAVVQFRVGLSGPELDTARQALAEQLWRSKAGGIDTYGDHSADVTDSIGQTRTLRWSEPTAVEVWVDVNLRYDAATYAGTDAVEAAILEYGNTMTLGSDVIRARLICAVIDVPGVTDVVDIRLGRTSASKRSENLEMGPRELAVFDSSRIS